MKLTHLMALAAPILALTPVAQAVAETVESTAVIVTAAGYEQDTTEAPASSTVITQKELMTKPVADIGQAVGDVPGVDITQTKMGNTQVSIRGFSPEYTLMLIDGRKQNTSDGMINNGFDAGSFYMPPVGMIDRIEVLRGPASVQYGSDAVGGVVNVITKKHFDSLTGSISFDRKQFFQDDVWGNQTGVSAVLGIPLKKDVASLQLRGRYFDRDASEVLTPAGKYAGHSPSAGYTGNIGGRLNLTINEANEVYLDADYSRFQGGSMSTSNTSVKNVRTWEKATATLGHTGKYKIGTLDSYLQFNELAYVKTETSKTAQSSALAKPGVTKGSFSDPLAKSGTWTASTKLVTPFDFGDNGAMTLATGLMYEYEFYKDNSSTAAGSSIAGKTLDQSTLAAFAEGEYFINDQWTATLGGRLHWSDIYGTHFAPRAYLVYRPAEWLSFKGGIASGYKTPAIKHLYDGEYYVGQSGRADNRYIGDPDLKPEESWNYELSATLRAPGWGSVTGGVFYTDFKNKLATEFVKQVGNTSYYKDMNLTKVRARGFELLAETAKFAGFSAKLGYTFTDAEIRSGIPTGWTNGKRPNELPRHTLTTRFDYENGGFGAYVKTTTKADAMVNRTRGAAYREKYKNCTTVDLGANYTYAKNHHFAVALNNLFDTGVEWTYGSNNNGTLNVNSWANAYREYIEGRNIWLNYTYTF